MSDDRLRLRSIADFRAVVATPEGRRFCAELMAPAFESSFTTDPLATAYNEGRRGAALAVLARLNDHAPEALLAMIAATAQERAAAEAAETLARSDPSV